MIDTMLIAGLAIGLAGGVVIGALAMAIWIDRGEDDDA